MKALIQCLHCGKPRSVAGYELKRGGGKFCSRACSNSFRTVSQETRERIASKNTKQKVILSCLSCSSEFSVRPGDSQKRKYCSPKCVYLSEEYRAKRSLIARKSLGLLSHRWKGGLTPKDKLIRESFEYANWRKEVLKRDGFTCQSCGQKGYKPNARLEVDHIKPFSLFPELRFDVKNGRTLCRPCHFKTDTFGWKLFHSQTALTS